MKKATLCIEQFNIDNDFVDIKVSFDVETPCVCPRVSVLFEAGEDNRRIPMRVEVNGNKVVAVGRYETGYIFYKKSPKNIKVSFVFSDGETVGDVYKTDKVITDIKPNKFNHFCRMSKREHKKAILSFILSVLALPFRLLPIKKNRVSFITSRTSTPTGNLKAIYETVKTDQGIETKVLCHNPDTLSNIKNLFKFLCLFMTSKIVYVDDYYHFISYIKCKKPTKIIQLWHGVGAFKTFGFSRIHKDSKLEVYSANHRQYDYAIVSSDDVVDYYAEAFGINSQNVLPLGSPRCDALIDIDYQAKVSDKFYSAYPHLKGKKILLFAPTFRGGGNGDAYYPVEKFDVDKVLDILGDDWAVVVKLHPYSKETFECSPNHKNQFADCFEWDVNDVLIMTDFLVTDYSSVIFEAALLDKPMVFLAFDEEEFANKRDSFLEFRHFVPSTIVDTDEKAALFVKDNNVDMQKIADFKNRAFGNNCGKACNNMLELTKQIINNN